MWFSTQGIDDGTLHRTRNGEPPPLPGIPVSLVGQVLSVFR